MKAWRSSHASLGGESGAGELLSSQRTVISLDYSGSGDTVDDGGVLTLEKLARQMVAVAKAAGAETFDLIGYSLGSVIATFVAAEYPKLVRSVVLLTGFLWGGDSGLKLQYDLWLDLIRTNHQAYMRLLLLSGLTPAFLTNLGTSKIEEMVAGSTAMVKWEGFARQIELNLNVDIRAQAQRVIRPVLVIGGAPATPRMRARWQTLFRGPCIRKSMPDTLFFLNARTNSSHWLPNSCFNNTIKTHVERVLCSTRLH